MTEKNKYNVLGIMSGTSLDGLDLAVCQFHKEEKWRFDILETHSVPFTENMKTEIRNAIYLPAVEFIEFHRKFGLFIAKEIRKLTEFDKIELIASHGHTIIHYPHRKLNFQLGDGAVIAAETGKATVSDFRSIDILLGGQGAPLVPAGEKLLFPEFDSFLNIGGFSNISSFNKKIIAYDISPANYALNYYAQKKFSQEFDINGEIGKKGNINYNMLKELNSIKYYSQKAPKSLSDHWFFNVFVPIVDKFEISDIDKYRTLYEHIAFQISENINLLNCEKVMITGGGAFNVFLMSLIQKKSKLEIIIPQKDIVEFKEAVIFAFLGLQRWIEKPNCLAEVTGAKYDNIGGAIYLPKNNFI